MYSYLFRKVTSLIGFLIYQKEEKVIALVIKFVIMKKELIITGGNISCTNGTWL